LFKSDFNTIEIKIYPRFRYGNDVSETRKVAPYNVPGDCGCSVDSCTLCFLCAFNLGSKPLYVATFLSFVYAIGYLIFIFVAGTTSGFGGFICHHSVETNVRSRPKSCMANPLFNQDID
jgi:hypothetical protein